MTQNERIKKLAFLRCFMAGLETYCIAPTAWTYIKSLGQSTFFLSLTLCAYNFGVVIGTPLLGYITDRFGNPRVIFICSCVVKMIAYVIYSVNLSAYFPLFGRLVSGVCEIGITILLGQIALQSSEDTRGGSFVALESAYCLGSVFGPAVGSLVTFHANIFGWQINEGNSVGIVLIIVWLIFSVSSLLLPSDIWTKTGDCHTELNSNSSNDRAGKRKTEVSQEQTVGKKIIKILLNPRITCILFLVFSSEFFSSTSTFYVPLLALDHFRLQLIHTKLLFLNCTLFTLAVLICLYLASEYFEERKLVLIAMLMQIIAISFLAYIAFFWNEITATQYYMLLLYICFGMPYFMYPLGSSLLSKITDPSLATFVQSSSFAVIHFAIVVSRVSVSFVFTKLSLLAYCSGMVILWFSDVIWFVTLFKKMAPDSL